MFLWVVELSKVLLLRYLWTNASRDVRTLNVYRVYTLVQSQRKTGIHISFISSPKLRRREFSVGVKVETQSICKQSNSLFKFKRNGPDQSLRTQTPTLVSDETHRTTSSFGCLSGVRSLPETVEVSKSL